MPARAILVCPGKVYRPLSCRHTDYEKRSNDRRPCHRDPLLARRLVREKVVVAPETLKSCRQAGA